MFDKIVMASNNAGKIKEFGTLFNQYQARLIPQGELNVPECPEPFLTFVENALAKARHASQHTGLPALADDSGICATALNGAPGIYSARYAGEHPKSDAANNQKLGQALAEHSNKEVWYACVLVLVRHPEDPLPIIAQGMWRGEFIATAAGENGFGYDPHFYLPDAGLTAAQMAPEHKNKISHRGRAMAILMQQLDALYGR